MEPLDDSIDHVRGGSSGRVIVEYGDYECPYSRKAFREIERVESELGLDFERFEADWASAGVLARIHRDVESGLASGEVLGTPTLFIDGVVHRGSYDAASLLQEVTVS